MKILKILFLLILVGQNSYSQSIYARIVAIDAKGRTDSVTFGQITGSTLGVDAALGEVDIFGVPYDSLDLRIIQRNSMCIDLNYPNNIDLKNDYRPGIGATFLEYSNFSFSVSADTFPVYVCLNSYQIGLYAHVYLYDNDCDMLYQTTINEEPLLTIDTLFILNSSSPSTFRIYPEVITDINENVLNFDLTLFPNPTTKNLFIESGNTKILATKIFDIRGHLISQTNQNPIDCSALKDGIYVVEVTTDREIIRKRIVKK